MNQTHLVLYGHFGRGNLGNDSSLEALLSSIRRYQPSAAVTCVCTGPQVIAERYGINTLPVDITETKQEYKPDGRLSGTARWAANRISDEMDFWLSRTRWFRTVDQFIVVGTGALDDMAVRPWNAPYDLFKWCQAAKLAGTRLVFLSVGAGPIRHWLSRAMMLRALRLADYRSYRDQASLEYVRGVGFDTSGDQVYPDLVFGLPHIANTPRLPAAARPQSVGLGVIGYYGWLHEPNTGEPLYLAYVAKLKEFVGWLLDQNYSVRLLTGDLPVDQRPVDDILQFARQSGQPGWPERVIAEPIADVEGLFEQIAQTDIVVAARFHNVVCSLMLGRPVVSIGYHEKNEALLAEMGLQAYCQHIEHFSVEELIRQFQSLASDLSPASQRIEHKCAEYRERLEAQYRTLLLPESSEALVH